MGAGRAIPHRSTVLGTNGSTLDAAKQFDIDKAFTAVGGDRATHEVRASSLIRYIQTTYRYTFERARDLLNVLVELGRAVWSTFSVVRIVA